MRLLAACCRLCLLWWEISFRRGKLSWVYIMSCDDRTNPPPRKRGKYYGIVGMVWAVAFTLGPLIGGAFTKGVSWRWCFYVNRESTTIRIKWHTNPFAPQYQSQGPPSSSSFGYSNYTRQRRRSSPASRPSTGRAVSLSSAAR